MPYEQIPPTLVKAFLAAEDRKFFEHGGIDLQGLVRASSRDVWNMVRGRKLQGGSTITQQVAKNVLLNNDATFGRKIKEAILARRLEETLPKERILELYLNEIWLGYRSYGVAAAAYNYFGKPLNELTVAQMAYLAALPKGPDNYHPIRHRTAALGRRNWIIGEMANMGAISRQQADQALHEDLKVQTAPERTHYRDADYFLEEARLRANGVVGKKAEDGGLYIRTTLDSQAADRRAGGADARAGSLRPSPRLARGAGAHLAAARLGEGGGLKRWRRPSGGPGGLRRSTRSPAGWFTSSCPPAARATSTPRT